jgi:DNA-directed RNA polymerase subunit M/transcription elongation factor TFIIS
MDMSGQTSVQSTSEQQLQRNQLQRPADDNIPQQTSPLDTSSSALNPPQNIPSFTALPPSIAINSTKDLPLLVTSQFPVPPLSTSLSSGESASHGIRTSPNPALQVSLHPMNYSQDAPTDYNISRRQDDDGPPPAQRRKLSSPEKQGQALRSDEESESRRASAGKGAMSYDPVHEHHQSAHSQHHGRRPSSANSQRSHMSSYSAQSSNAEPDEATSPNTGDQPMSRDGKKRKHKCQECGQYFTRLHNLKSHLLTHSQEKPFICQECGHKFRRLHDLKRNFLKLTIANPRTP